MATKQKGNARRSGNPSKQSSNHTARTAFEHPADERQFPLTDAQAWSLKLLSRLSDAYLTRASHTPAGKHTLDSLEAWLGGAA